MVSKHALKLAGLAATLTLLAGCGQSALTSAASGDTLALRQAGADGQPGDRGGKPGKGFRGERGGKGGRFGPLGLLQGVNLTDDQKAQLKAIAEKYRPATGRGATGPGGAPADGEKKDAPGAKVRELLLADTVDAAALKAALADRPQPPADAKNRLAMLVEARAVLTDDQRNALVEKLKSLPTPPAHSDRPSPSATPG